MSSLRTLVRSSDLVRVWRALVAGDPLTARFARRGMTFKERRKGKSMKTMYVYIMANSRHTVLYVGVTNDLMRRTEEHKQKILGGFTARYNVDKLVYYEMTESEEAAISREKYLKKCYRKTKEKLITAFNPDWKDLSDSFY